MSTVSSHYGDPSDYDEWARLGGEGAECWAYKDFQKSAKFLHLSKMSKSVLTSGSCPFRYFRKFEKFVPSKAHPGVNADEHGSDGPVESKKKHQCYSA
jgi:choline dehydrogenase